MMYARNDLQAIIHLTTVVKLPVLSISVVFYSEYPPSPSLLFDSQKAKGFHQAASMCRNVSTNVQY